MEVSGSYTIKFPIEFEKDKVKKETEELKKKASEGLFAGFKSAFEKTDNPLKEFGKKLGNVVKDTFRNIKDYFVDIVKSSVSEMNRMLEFSQMSNRDVRELAFQYGFSSSESYGWDKAMTQLGFSGEEDLMYANQQELQQFRKAFEKYSSYYDKLAESGYFEKMQEQNVAMEDFRMEIQQEVIGFFIENKDFIVNGMKAIMEINKGVLKLVSWFVRDSGSSKIASTSDIVAQYNTTTSSTSNASLNVNNTFNNVDSSTSGDLSREVNMEYRQVIKALGGNV